MAVSTQTQLFLAFFFFLSFLAAAANAEDHDVGDDTKWQVPTDVNFYATWASRQTFRVGDRLEFEFTTPHDVAEVTQAAFAACTTTNPISLNNTSPVTVTLNATGERYFICTIGSHCTNGQKVAVNVVSANAPPTSAPTPPAGTSNTTNSTGTPPPSPSSASTSSPTLLVMMVGFVVCIISKLG